MNKLCLPDRVGLKVEWNKVERTVGLLRVSMDFNP